MAKIREHSPPVAGWCIHCQTRQVDGVWPSDCVEREDWLIRHKPLPETPRGLACEDADAIAARMAQIRSTEVPQCPRSTGMTLYACLRATRCSADCPYVHDWIGPNGEGFND